MSRRSGWLANADMQLRRNALGLKHVRNHVRAAGLAHDRIKLFNDTAVHADAR